MGNDNQHAKRSTFTESQGERPLQALRLHRSLERSNAATLQRLFSTLSGNSKKASATRAAPHMQPLFRPHRSKRGSGGKRVFASPRRLYAAFDARKRPPTPIFKPTCRTKMYLCQLSDKLSTQKGVRVRTPFCVLSITSWGFSPYENCPGMMPEQSNHHSATVKRSVWTCLPSKFMVTLYSPVGTPP